MSATPTPRHRPSQSRSRIRGTSPSPEAPIRPSPSSTRPRARTSLPCGSPTGRTRPGPSSQSSPPERVRPGFSRIRPPWRSTKTAPRSMVSARPRRHSSTAPTGIPSPLWSWGTEASTPGSMPAARWTSGAIPTGTESRRCGSARRTRRAASPKRPSLSSLTVTTDSPYVVVNGHILTLAFPADWTNAEILITVSDGSAVALQTVRVAFAIIPAWWTSPYVLAIPPIGVFVVVALFAQRARWRPAKAFLVDERSQMIREFTLDPSCQVTYGEAVKAGALDAVEKPVKVAKYHAQTVRGDALAVVLLAYGPVNLEQVEFAREMLVQIQDRFEDSVQKRLAEARAYETELENRGRQVVDNETAMEARASEIDSMLQQVEAAQMQISTDTAALVAREESLEVRERQFAEDRRAVDDLSRELEDLRASLDKRSAKIQEQAGDVVRKAEALVEREAAIAPTEEAFEKRDRALEQAEADLRVRSEEATAKASDLAARESVLAEREASVAQEEDGLAAARRTFEEEQKDLLAFRATVESRVADVERAEADVASNRAQVEEMEARIAPQEQALSDREAALAEQEANIQAEVERRARHLEEKEARLSEETDRLRVKGE